MKSRINTIALSGASGTTAWPQPAKRSKRTQMRRQRCRDIGLTFDRRHRIVFPAEDEGRTLHS